MRSYTYSVCVEFIYSCLLVEVGRLQSLDWTGGLTQKIAFIETYLPVGLYGVTLKLFLHIDYF